MILNSFSHLFIDDNRRPLRQWLSWLKMSALIPTSSIFSGSSCTPLSSGLDKFNTWDCSCEHAQGCSRPFGCGWCPSMQQSGPSLPSVFCVPFFHSFSIVAFASGINIAWDEKSCVHTSRFGCPKHASNSRFPKFADQNISRNSYFILPKFTLESVLYSPDF